MSLKELFETVLLLSAAGSALAGVILLVKTLFGCKLSAGLHYALWFVLLIRMLIPVSIDSPIGISRWLQPSQGYFTQNSPVHQPSPGSTSGGQTNPPIAADPAARPAETDLMQVAAVVWAAGAAAAMLYIGTVNLLFARKLRRCAAIGRADVAASLRQCRAQMGIRAKVTLLCGSAGKPPMLWGLFHPRIVIPEGLIEGLSEEDIRYILLHELAHVRRMDLLVNTLGLAIQAIHWFNPIIWYCAHRMKQDCEIACDATALSRLGAQEHRAYGKTVVNLLQIFSAARLAPSTVGFVNNYHKRRITMIAQQKKTSLICTLAAVALCLTVLAGCASLSTPVDRVAKAAAAPELTGAGKPTPTPSADTPQTSAAPQESATPAPTPEATPGKTSAVEKTNRYEVAGIDDPQGFETAFRDLQALVAKDDRAAVAGYVSYPIQANIDGKRVKIASEADFLKNYDKIMTATVKAALLAQKVEETFVNYKGVMVGQGELWITMLSGTKQLYTIYGINN